MSDVELAGWWAGYETGARAPAFPNSAPEPESLADMVRRLERTPYRRPVAPVAPTPAELEAERSYWRDPHPVVAYMGLQEPQPARSTLPAVLRELRADPHRGVTPGELAELELRAGRYQYGKNTVSEPPPPPSPGGLVVDTELRETLDQIAGYEQRFSERAALLRAVQTMPQLRGHRVGVCLRYMAEVRRSKGMPTGDVDPVSALDATERAATVQVVGRRSKVAPELGLPMPTALPIQPRFRGVAVCGSGWVCPMCAARITEGRRRELERGCDRHRAAGGLVLLVTQTFSHGRSDDLAASWESLGRARQRFARSGVVKKFRERVGFVGRVACREVTFGLNGWHPHAHELVFIAGGLTAEVCAELERELAREWQACCAAVGLSCSLEHGFKVSLTEAASYVAKWGLDSELTKWQLKRGRVDVDAGGELSLAGLTPFDLLRVYAGEIVRDVLPVLFASSASREPDTATVCGRAAHLFAEYAQAVVGTAQLHWTRGLKAALAVDELSDVELAERDEADEFLLGTITAHEWFVLVHRRNQVEFLGLVAAQGWSAAKLFLDHWVSEFDRYGAAALRRRLMERRLRRDAFGERVRWRKRKGSNDGRRKERRAGVR